MTQVGTASLSVSPGDIIPRGNELVLVGRFLLVEALDGSSEPLIPGSVAFTILAPDETTIEFTDLDPNVSNPAYGVYECLVQPLLPSGTYHAHVGGWDGSSESGGMVAQSADQAFVIVESPVDVAVPPPRPVMGPCTQWISGEDVAGCTRVDYGEQPAVFDAAAYDAGMALFEISQRQFPGICERKVRPCRDDCGCWLNGPISYGMGPWFWTTVPWGFGGAWAWANERGDSFGCKPMSRVRLAGYPVSQILEVLIDGVVLPEFDPDSGFRNWRLDKWRYLVRMDLPGVDGGSATPRFWPSCQNMSLDTDQPGTFSVTYKWGTDVPHLGRAAAVELANQFFLACGGQDCVLPTGVVRAVRQGIEIERGLLANFLDPTKPTGLVQLDAFLAAYCRGQRGGRKSALWSPDVQQFARKLGVR